MIGTHLFVRWNRFSSTDIKSVYKTLLIQNTFHPMGSMYRCNIVDFTLFCPLCVQMLQMQIQITFTFNCWNLFETISRSWMLFQQLNKKLITILHYLRKHIMFTKSRMKREREREKNKMCECWKYALRRKSRDYRIHRQSQREKWCIVTTIQIHSEYPPKECEFVKGFVVASHW